MTRVGSLAALPAELVRYHQVVLAAYCDLHDSLDQIHSLASQALDASKAFKAVRNLSVKQDSLLPLMLRIAVATNFRTLAYPELSTWIDRLGPLFSRPLIVEVAVESHQQVLRQRFRGFPLTQCEALVAKAGEKVLSHHYSGKGKFSEPAPMELINALEKALPREYRMVFDPAYKPQRVLATEPAKAVAAVTKPTGLSPSPVAVQQKAPETPNPFRPHSRRKGRRTSGYNRCVPQQDFFEGVTRERVILIANAMFDRGNNLITGHGLERLPFTEEGLYNYFVRNWIKLKRIVNVAGWKPLAYWEILATAAAIEKSLPFSSFEERAAIRGAVSDLEATRILVRMMIEARQKTKP